LLSPAENYFHINVAEALRSCRATKVLFILGALDPPEDRRNYVSGHRLYLDFPGRYKKEAVFNKLGHGTGLLWDQGIVDAVIAWVKDAGPREQAKVK